jgi:hypothetical protein
MTSAFTSDEVGQLIGSVMEPAETAPMRVEPGPSGSLQILPALIEVMRDVTHVGKDGRNLEQKYAFRGIDGVMNAVGPAVRRHGVIAVPYKIEMKYRDTLTTGREPRPTREVTNLVTYRFYAADGSFIEAQAPGESLDQSDKGSAKAMSVALRIIWLQMLTLPTQEPTTDHDGQYLTRSSDTRLTAFERSTGLAMLTPPTAEQRETAGEEMLTAAFSQALAFKACLDEHSAWDQPSGDENAEQAPTWRELFTGRVAAEIEATDTGVEVNQLWNTLKAVQLDMEHDGKRFTQLLKERGQTIKERNATALNTITQQVLTSNLDDLEGDNSPVLRSIGQAYDLGRITYDEWKQLRALFEERRDKLTAELPGEPATGPEGES